MKRLSDIAARLMAVIAIRAGVRVPACMMPVPSRMREVRAAMKASGVTASWPQASADHTQSTPRRSASTTYGARRRPVLVGEPEGDGDAHADQSRTTRSWRDRFIARAPELVIKTVSLTASPHRADVVIRRFDTEDLAGLDDRHTVGGELGPLDGGETDAMAQEAARGPGSPAARTARAAASTTCPALSPGRTASLAASIPA